MQAKWGTPLQAKTREVLFLSKRVKYVSRISIKMRIHVPCYDILRRTHESLNILLTQWLILRFF